MKFVLLACLAAVAAAAPQFQDSRPIVVVLRDDRQDNGDGNFNFAFEADNGIYEERSGTPGLQGQSNMQGSYRWVIFGTPGLEGQSNMQGSYRWIIFGIPGLEGQRNIQGSYRFPLPDGTFAEVRFVADESGFRPESPLLPTPHPLPAHAIEQIRIAEDQRARGITFE